MPQFDLIIRGGNIIDGTGAPAFRADVAVRDRRIAAIGGDLEGDATRIIDAAGLAVASGFIDVHAHDDDAVMSTCMDFKLLQGVTTDIVGNCGAGMAPRDPARPPMPGVNVVLGASQEGDWQSFGEYMDAVDRAELAVNVGCFVPHGAVRYFALGMERREAGVDVTFDAYPYTAGSTILAVMARRPEAGPDSVMVSSVRGKPEF